MAETKTCDYCGGNALTDLAKNVELATTLNSRAVQVFASAKPTGDICGTCAKAAIKAAAVAL